MANFDKVIGVKSQLQFPGLPLDVRSVLTQQELLEDVEAYEGMIYYDLDEGQVKIVSGVDEEGTPTKTAQLLSSDSTAQFLTQADKATLEICCSYF